jgi:hypothetical protein
VRQRRASGDIHTPVGGGGATREVPDPSTGRKWPPTLKIPEFTPKKHWKTSINFYLSANLMDFVDKKPVTGKKESFRR